MIDGININNLSLYDLRIFTTSWAFVFAQRTSCFTTLWLYLSSSRPVPQTATRRNSQLLTAWRRSKSQICQIWELNHVSQSISSQSSESSESSESSHISIHFSHHEIFYQIPRASAESPEVFQHAISEAWASRPRSWKSSRHWNWFVQAGHSWTQLDTAGHVGTSTRQCWASCGEKKWSKWHMTPRIQMDLEIYRNP